MIAIGNLRQNETSVLISVFFVNPFAARAAGV